MFLKNCYKQYSDVYFVLAFFYHLVIALFLFAMFLPANLFGRTSKSKANAGGAGEISFERL